MIKKEFVKTPDGKEVLYCDGFDIVYVADISNHMEKISNGNFIISKNDPENEVTSIRVISSEKNYILKGDWKKEFAKNADKGLQAVMSVYVKNKKEHMSLFSHDPENDTPEKHKERLKFIHNVSGNIKTLKEIIEKKLGKKLTEKLINSVIENSNYEEENNKKDNMEDSELSILSEKEVPVSEHFDLIKRIQEITGYKSFLIIGSNEDLGKPKTEEVEEFGVQIGGTRMNKERLKQILLMFIKNNL